MASRRSSSRSRSDRSGDDRPPRGSSSESAARPLDALRALVRGGDDRPGLIDVLPRLQKTHRKELRRREQWTHGDLARHPEPRELIRSRRRPGNIGENGQLVRIFDARRELVEDVHENRVVRHAVNDVRRRLLAIDDPEAVVLLGELDAALSQAPFLREVGELRARPTEPTATLSGDPLYRAVFHGWLALDAR
jgi:Domain of unknown function (DUF2357)